MTRMFHTRGNREWRGAVVVAAAVAMAAFGPLKAGPESAGPPAVSVVSGPTVTSDTISIDVENVPIRKVVDYVARQTGYNFIVEKDVQLNVTQRLIDVDWRKAMELILKGSGCYLEEEGANIYRLSKPLTVTLKGTDDVRKAVNMIADHVKANVVVSPEVKGVVDYSFTDVPWTQALETIVKTAGYVIVREHGVMRVVSPSALKAQLETRIFQLKYIKPPSSYTAKSDTPYAVSKVEAVEIDGKSGVPTTFTLYNALKSALSDKGRLQYDVASNSFIITDTKPVMDQIQAIIEKVDVEPMQVFVDVRFVTTTSSDDLDFGVDWEKGITATLAPGSMTTRFPFSRGANGGRYIENVFGLTDDGYSPADVATFLGGSSAFQFGTLSFAAATSVLKLLKNDENTQVRQAPRLTVLNHQPGTVFVGSTIRFAEIFSSSSQGGTLATGVREADNSPINTGFQLLVVPHIVRGSDDILMTIIPESNSLTEFKEFGAAPNVIELPQISSSTVVTQMLIRDGRTAVIGGLVVDREEDQVRKVPFLGDIPGVGYVFKAKTRTRAKDHLMIFITPRIVRTAKDARKVFVCHKKYDWPMAPCKEEDDEEMTPAPAEGASDVAAAASTASEE